MDLELILMLIDKLRAEGMELVVNPGARDAFAFGEAHGYILAAARMEELVNELVEESRARARSEFGDQ
jgi:hypothetical protein